VQNNSVINKIIHALCPHNPGSMTEITHWWYDFYSYHQEHIRTGDLTLVACTQIARSYARLLPLMAMVHLNSRIFFTNFSLKCSYSYV